ncbi:MAG: hypothetical protein M4579_006165 [Chaenotheca gracillima]|nr:MAG: hypothetical protein M4579_006165 [Chaenotheca gracillima]
MFFSSDNRSWVFWVLVLPFTCVKGHFNPWGNLNQTVKGRLHAAKPFALPCFSSYNGQHTSSDATACDAVQKNYGNASFRSEVFSGYMESQAEICALNAKDQCLLDDTNPSNPLAYADATCGQGSISPYYIEVHEASDVQAALRFSKRTGIKLSIKNSGHDYLSRSILKGSLALWVRKLDTLSYNPKFVPTGCRSSDRSRAITVGAGVNFDEVYTYAHSRRVTYVGGSSPTVGVSGGWVMNGGHSLLSPVYGLGIDRVLEFKIVTPDGVLRTANACTNPDLFWALRGGGGGTFGVVLESTARVEPEMSLSIASVSFPPTATNGQEFLSLILNNTLPWSADGWGGVAGPTFLNSVNPLLDLAKAKKSMAPLTTYVEAHNGTVTVETYPNWLEFYTKFIKPSGESGVGSTDFPASRLIDKSLFASEKGRSDLMDYLAHLLELKLPPTIFTTTPSHYTPPKANLTSATPAWRSSVWDLATQVTWAWNSTVKDKQATVAQLKDLTDRVEAITPNGGAYANEANPWTHNWQESWWGKDNYASLLAVKKRYDPDGLLNCWRCVGWEESEQAPGRTFECMGALGS